MSTLLLFGVGAGILVLAGLVHERNKPQEPAQKKTAVSTAGMTRGERNNNPGNVRFNSAWVWQGQIGQDDAGYLIFDSASNGVRAMAKDLLTKYSRGLDTVREIITVYAPAFENPTETYVRTIAADMGVHPDAKITLTDRAVLTNMVRAMIRFENGRISFDGATIQTGIRKALP